VVLLDMHMPGMDGAYTTIVIRNTPEIKDVVIIILSSLGSRGDVADMKEIGCNSCLVKPVKQSLLFDTISIALNEKAGGKRPEAHRSVITRHTMTDKKYQNIRILLAEDNEINQKVVLNILKKAGYVNVDVAGNGRMAVEAADKTDYDIIFMDVQMPVMDGFEATKLIRERGINRRRDIIVAMTAHALKEDRQRCMEAGMDDYIPKPINPQDIFTIIGKWIKVNPESLPSGIETKVAYSKELSKEGSLVETPIDVDDAMKRFDNDMEFYKNMLNEYINYVPGQVKALEDALTVGDVNSIQRIAHNIKGSSGNLSAGRIVTIALNIENKGRNNELTEIPSLISGLKEEITNLKQFSSTIQI